MRHVYPEGTKTILMRHNNITSRLAMCAVHNLDKTCPHSENTIEPCASPSLNTRFEQGCYNGVVQARQVRIIVHINPLTAGVAYILIFY